MSSTYVRTQIKNFLTTIAPTETFIDLTARFEDIEDLITDAGLDRMDPWIGLQFVGNEEIPITIGADNTKGKYRELGAVFIHIVDVAKLGVGDTILGRAETLRGLLRGRRVGTLFIESVSPPNFEQGATLQFEAGYMSASFIATYTNDVDL